MGFGNKSIRYLLLTYSGDIQLSAGVAVTVALAETALRWVLFPLTGPLSFLGGLSVSAGIFIGLRARWGVATGALAANAVVGSVRAGVIAAIAGFIGVTICTWLWDNPALNTAWVLHSLRVVAVTVTSMAGTAGFLAVLFAASDFHITVLEKLSQWVPPTAACLLLVVWHSRDTDSFLPEPMYPTASRQTKRRISYIVVLWSCFGFIGSFVFNALGLVPAAVLGRRLGPGVSTAFELTGEGRLLILLLGVVSLGLLAVVMIEDSRPASAQ